MMPNQKNISLNVLKDTTCFNEHKKRKLNCENTECRLWINCEEHLNCTVLGSEQGPMTLQEIGEIFGVTRMRICQIEKVIMKKLMDTERFNF